MLYTKGAKSEIYCGHLLLSLSLMMNLDFSDMSRLLQQDFQEEHVGGYEYFCAWRARHHEL